MKYKKVEVVVSKDADKILKKNLERDSEDGKLTIFIDSIDLYSRIFSPRRKEILELVMKEQHLTVDVIALKLHRKKEAVSRDLSRLTFEGLIELKKKGRNVFVSPTAKEIRFRIEEKPIICYA